MLSNIPTPLPFTIVATNSLDFFVQLIIYNKGASLNRDYREIVKNFVRN